VGGACAVVILVVLLGRRSVELSRKWNEVRAEQIREGVVERFRGVRDVVRLASEVRNSQDRRLASVECQRLLQSRDGVHCGRVHVLAVIDPHCYQDPLDLCRQWCSL